MKKLKVIQIAHASHSYFANKDDDLKKIILNDWYAKLSKQLKKFYPDIEIECWAPEKLDKKESIFKDSNVVFRFFPITLSPVYALDFSIPMLRALKQEIKKSEKKGDKIIIHLHEYHNLHGLLIATLFRNQKIIAQHHGGSWPLKHLKENKKYRLFSLFFRVGQIWENLVLKNINCFYALTQEEINYLKKVTSKSKIRFQTMGIDDEYFKKVSKRIARKKLGLGLNKKIIIFLGRISSVKGVGILLEAMKKLPNVQLKIMGYGKEREEFEDYVKKNGLKNVEFLGGVFGEKKFLYLSAADALILPSSKEGAPVTIMEALARNLPVVATNIGGIPLMIKNNKNGIIIKPTNTKEIVRGIKKILKWKNKNLKKYANKYKWKEIIKETIKEYES